MESWKHLKLAGYLIPNSDSQLEYGEIRDGLRGGLISLVGPIRTYVNSLEEEVDLGTEIFFPAKADNDDTYLPTKFYLEKASLKNDDEALKDIAVKLVQALDKRINEGLLLVLTSQDVNKPTKRRIALYYLPVYDTAYQLEEFDGNYDLKYLKQVYINSGKKFKVAAFTGESGGSFSKGVVSNNAKNSSKYWIEDFLGASFELGSSQVQNKIAKTLKKIAKKSAVEAKELNERNEDGLSMPEESEWEPAFDFDTTINEIESMDDEEEITIDRIITEYIPESHQATVERSFPEEVRALPFKAQSTKETFKQQFKRKKIRAILSDNSVIEIIGTREDIEKHLKKNEQNGEVTFTLKAKDVIEDLMR